MAEEINLQQLAAAYIRDKQLSQRNAAPALGVSRSTLKRVLSGEKPGPDVFERLTRRLSEPASDPPVPVSKPSYTVFVDESRGSYQYTKQKRLVIGVALFDTPDVENSLRGFTNTVYPLGWTRVTR